PYEDFMKHLVNPDNPTPSGFSYWFPSSKPLGTTVDDCQQQSGTLFEYKGWGYERHFLKHDFIWTDRMLPRMLQQAEDQRNAAGSRELVWVFHERRVAIFMRNEFKRLDLNIQVRYFRMPGR